MRFFCWKTRWLIPSLQDGIWIPLLRFFVFARRDVGFPSWKIHHQSWFCKSTRTGHQPLPNSSHWYKLQVEIVSLGGVLFFLLSSYVARSFAKSIEEAEGPRESNFMSLSIGFDETRQKQSVKQVLLQAKTFPNEGAGPDAGFKARTEFLVKCRIRSWWSVHSSTVVQYSNSCVVQYSLGA